MANSKLLFCFGQSPQEVRDSCAHLAQNSEGSAGGDHAAVPAAPRQVPDQAIRGSGDRRGSAFRPGEWISIPTTLHGIGPQCTSYPKLRGYDPFSSFSRGHGDARYKSIFPFATRQMELGRTTPPRPPPTPSHSGRGDLFSPGWGLVLASKTWDSQAEIASLQIPISYLPAHRFGSGI